MTTEYRGRGVAGHFWILELKLGRGPTSPTSAPSLEGAWEGE